MLNIKKQFEEFFQDQVEQDLEKNAKLIEIRETYNDREYVISHDYSDVDIANSKNKIKQERECGIV